MEPASATPRGRLGAVIVAVLAFVGMVLLLNRRHDRDSRPRNTPTPRRQPSPPHTPSPRRQPSGPRASASEPPSAATAVDDPPDPPTSPPTDPGATPPDDPRPTLGDIARYVLGTVSLFVGATLLWFVLWALFPVAAPGWSPHAISSGSMEPLIQRGDVMLTSPPPPDQALEPPAVVAFTDPTHGDHVLHRIVETNDDGTYVTRGDANGGPDSTPLEPDRVTGVGRLVVPLVGLPAVWLGEGRVVPVAATATILLLLAWASRFALFDRHDPWLGAAPRSPRSAPPGPRQPASHNGPSTTNSSVVALITLFSLIVAASPVEAVTHGAFTATTETQATWSTGEWVDETTAFFLKTDVEGDTDTTLTLPMSEDEPTQTDLPNYSANLDDRPGRFIYRGGTGPGDDDTEELQLWVMEVSEETVLHGGLSLTIWAEIAGGASDQQAGELTATAFTCGPNFSNCAPLGEATAVSDDPWGDSPGFVEKTAVFGDVTHTLEESDLLAVLVQVSGDSGDDMSLAYDTVDHPSRLELEPAPPPATPENLTVTDTASSSVDLAWDAVDDADSYRVRHRQDGTATWTETDAIDATSTTVGGLSSETAYEFQVRAEHLSAPGDWSATVIATTDPHDPMWWDDAYGYRAQLTVTTGGTAPVNRYEDYTVRAEVDTAALIADDRLQGGCQDLRVLRWSGDAWTELHRDIDDCGTTTTEVWFALAADIADSASDDSYWLYFDGPSAGSGPADRDEVYLFHDDFEGHALGEVPAGWTVQSGGPWNVVDDGGDRVLRREGGDGGTHLIQVEGVSEHDVLIETRMRTGAGSGDLAMCAATRMTGLDASDAEHYAGCMARFGGDEYSLLLRRANGDDTLLGGQGAAFDDQDWYRVGLATYGSTVRMWRDGAPVPSATDGGITSTSSVGLRVDLGGDDTDFDDVTVRRYTEPEPTVEVGAPEPF